MIIIKHGIVPPEPQFLFNCPKCGCKFKMTQSELRQEYQSLIYSAVWKCPDCGLHVSGKEIKETENE